MTGLSRSGQAECDGLLLGLDRQKVTGLSRSGQAEGDGSV